MSLSEKVVQIRPKSEQQEISQRAMLHVRTSLLNRAKSASITLLTFVPVLALAGFICFNNLDWGTLTIPDEVYEVQASIEMLQGDRWWLPTHNGDPWLHKPPLKMWMTWPAIKYFADSNFAFRLVDALSGIGLTAMLFFFSLSLFGSRLAAFSSAVAFLGCDILIRYHGVRSANQDAMLVFWSTLALMAAWNILESTKGTKLSGVHYRIHPSTESKSLSTTTYIWAFVGGVSLGCAVLTKSAGGLISLIIVGVFCAFSGRLGEILSRGWKPVLLTLLSAAAVICAYFVPVCLVEEGAFGEYFTENIYGRVLHGYHSVEPPLFYLERLFPERAAVPPELLVFGILVALFCWIKKRDERFGFILVWAVLPVACFSISKIKLSWYIASCLPGMALLVGALLYACEQVVINRRAYHSRILPLASSLLLIASVPLLLVNAKGSIDSTYLDKGNIPFDTLVKEIRTWEFANKRDARVVFFDAPARSLREQPYGLLLEGRELKAEQETELVESLQKSEVDFLFTRAEQLEEILTFANPTHYATLPPDHSRFDWLVVYGFTGSGEFSRLARTQTRQNFGAGEARVISGFGEADGFGERPVRWTMGPKSELLIKGNPLFHKQAAELRLNLAPHTGYPERMQIKISINNHPIADFWPSMHVFKEYSFNVPLGILHSGDNLVSFELSRKNGGPVEPQHRFMMLDWISVGIPQMK
jgi:4-amino-4-deoxy-L-arabinose transferase-like glycosyltransferase